MEVRVKDSRHIRRKKKQSKMISKHRIVEENKNRGFLSPHYSKKEDCCRFSIANSYSHEMAKAKICIYLKKNNRKFITEAIMKSGRRADVFDLTEGIVYEVTETETQKSIKAKRDDYSGLIFVDIPAARILNATEKHLEKLVN